MCHFGQKGATPREFFLTPTVDLPDREMVNQTVQCITTDDRPSRRALKGRQSYGASVRVKSEPRDGAPQNAETSVVTP